MGVNRLFLTFDLEGELPHDTLYVGVEGLSEEGVFLVGDASLQRLHTHGGGGWRGG